MVQGVDAAEPRSVLVLPSAIESLQTTVPANASGVLLYSPSGTVLNGQDFSSFLQAAHKKTKVTGDVYRAEKILPSLNLVMLGCSSFQHRLYHKMRGKLRAANMEMAFLQISS